MTRKPAKSPRNGVSRSSSVQPISVGSKLTDIELFATSLPGYPGQAKIVVLIRSTGKQNSFSLAILRVAIEALFSKFRFK